MYSLRQARLALSRPKLVLREFNKWYHTLRQGEYNERGVDVFAEDWDTLVVLDAFRYDVFEEKYRDHGLPGRLESRISRGAATREFLRANVAGRELHDTVYVTASPHYYKNQEEERGEFHDVVHVWKEEGVDEARSQPPDVMTEYALRAAEEYPNKRLLLHYVQPHCPFLGETGRENFDDIRWVNHVGFGETTGEDVSHESVRTAYRENADVVLPYARELLETLDGKTVVTADHGQMLGERQRPIPLKDYGHPEGIYIDTLVEVPWLVHERGERREIVPEPPVERRADDGEAERVAEETLEDLGYLG
jgi:hypothetical protein